MALGNSNPPVKGQEFWTQICLLEYGTGDILTNPTIAAGDFKCWVDSVAFGNLDTLPDVEPDGEKPVRLSLSTAETDGHSVLVIWSDQTSPKQWRDGWFTLQTTAA